MSSPPQPRRLSPALAAPLLLAAQLVAATAVNQSSSQLKALVLLALVALISMIATAWTRGGKLKTFVTVLVATVGFAIFAWPGH